MTQGTNLLVDIGNSRIKWNLLPHGVSEFETDTQAFNWNEDHLPQQLAGNWRGIKETPRHVFIANVAAASVQNTVTQWCRDHWQIAPVFVSATAQFADIQNGYTHFQELGVDRWLAVIAAHQLFPNDTVIVIDCGSAITVDTILSDGQHRAGPIIPGNRMLLDCLAQRTAFNMETAAEEAAQPQAFVNDTKNAVMSGVNFATIQGLNAIMDSIVQQLTEAPSNNGREASIKVLVTGGASQQIMPLTTLKNYQYAPDLVLKGLQLVMMDDK